MRTIGKSLETVESLGTSELRHLLTVKDFPGNLNSTKMVLQLLSKNKTIPEFIQISQNSLPSSLVLPEIDNDFEFKVKANTIDHNDKIVFDLYQKK